MNYVVMNAAQYSDFMQDKATTRDFKDVVPVQASSGEWVFPTACVVTLTEQARDTLWSLGVIVRRLETTDFVQPNPNDYL